MDFNGFFVESEAGNFVVDPIDPDEATLQKLRERGVAAVVVTNRDHQRAAEQLVAATGAAVIASTREAPLLSVPVDRIVQDGDDVFGWRVIATDGAKTAGEIALYNRALRTLVVGDVLWGTPVGTLTLMPDSKLADPLRASLFVRRLCGLSIENVLVGDGAHVFGNGRDCLIRTIEAHAEMAASRINIDELLFESDPHDPKPYDGEYAEIGFLLGARRLGYAAARLRKGQVFCPLHWHTREEELFIVVSGTPSVRTPAGTWRLRPGDCMAFPTTEAGAHSLFNDTDGEAIVVLIANVDDGDVCYYPDSNKHVVEATGTLVRNEPQLNYFDREVPSLTLNPD